MKIGDKVKFIEDDWECVHKLSGKEGKIVAKSQLMGYDFEVQLCQPLLGGTRNWSAKEGHLEVIKK